MGKTPELKDIPIIGDTLYDWRQQLHGNPDAVKAAYDEQIAASQKAQADMRDFLSNQKRQAQAFYGPIQHMFENAYGTEGIQGPVIPVAQGPLATMSGGGK